MSNYTKATNFSAKDSLPTGDPNKVISGVQFDTEFDAIQSSNNSKADKVSSATSGNFAGLNTSGNLTDSGKSAASFYQLGGTDVAVADGGTGASTASGARTNLGLGSLAVKSTVATADIDDSSITTVKIGASQVTDAKLSKTTTAGSQAIAISGTWTVPAGFYTMGVASGGSVALEVSDGTNWHGGSFPSGAVISDGTNVRLRETSGTAGATVHYRKLS